MSRHPAQPLPPPDPMTLLLTELNERLGGIEARLEAIEEVVNTVSTDLDDLLVQFPVDEEETDV